MSEKVVVRSLWAVVVVLAIAFMVIMVFRGVEKAKEELLRNMGEQIEGVVHGEYKDYEFEYSSIHYIAFNNDDRIAVSEVIKSVVDNRYHELADTVYDTELRFNNGKVYLKLEAVYKGVNVHKELGIEEYLSLESEEYWEKMNEYMLENFRYRVVGKLDLREFIQNKVGQCYSLAEMGYVLGKEKGENVRLLVSSTHAWNEVYYDNGMSRVIDFSVGMEDDESEE